MSRCIIHIGMHKTGSTSIQNSLRHFQDTAVVYADIDKTPNHSLAIFSLFAPRPELHHLHKVHRDADRLAKYIKERRTALRRAMEDAAGRTLVLSGEDISFLPKASLKKMKAFLQKRFDDFLVVGYVRSPAAYIASGFQQRVKSGSVESIDLEREYRHYRTTFERFDEVFGRENVHLVKFDPPSFPDGCVVRDFCRRLDIRLPYSDIKRVNESLSRPVVALLYAFRKMAKTMGIAPMYGGEAKRIADLLMDNGGDKFRFSPDAVRPVLEQHREDIAWMEERLGQSLEEDLGDPRPCDVRDESDLLRPDPAAVRKLLELLGSRAPAGVDGRTPEEVAVLVNALREPPAGRPQRREEAEPPDAPSKEPAGNWIVRSSDLLAQIRRADAALLGGLPEDKAEALILGILRQLNETLGAAEDGVVHCAGLGRFEVKKQASGNENGRQSLRSRIVFRPGGAAASFRGAGAEGKASGSGVRVD